MGGLCLPPHPTSNKLGADARKGMKGFSDQGDVHSLKFLYNHHLQWRFANAKAEASMHYQRHESQSKLYSFAQQLSDLRKSVSQKHAEYIWGCLAHLLTEVHVDIKELGDALSSYTKVMEMIGLQIQNFMQKAEETESLISELFRVIGGEKTLIEEWGDLLMKTYISQEFTGADD
ncbi:protein ENDOSPERM DEFECTIVE 1-like [Solanum pennellii]|uniref:Protein ENDOSPERM DEFECTIVE 1-like n=1 Tax=Solanum pennellii TaxID=28526 RepID=A0ABM1VA57_SOLPN|nr:protein ENDOSPERM DEFECTIVE 1-like [Solanum pennellii]